MTIKLADIGLESIDTGIVETSAEETFAFTGFSNDLGTIPLGGYTIRKLSEVQAFGIKAGGKKLASGKATVKKINLNKIAARVVFEEEVIGTSGFFDAVTQELPSSNADLINKVVLGTVAVPTDWAGNIETLGTLEDNEIGVGFAAIADFVAARNKVARGKVTGLILTREMLNYLTSQYIEQTGQPAFNYDATANTLNLIPVRVVDVAGEVGYIGNWDKSWARLQPYPSPLTQELFRINDSGTVETVDGETVNLLDNMFAVTYESHAAFAYDPNFFVKIVPAAAVDPEA